MSPIWAMFVNELIQRHFKSKYIKKFIWFWELYKTSSTLLKTLKIEWLKIVNGRLGSEKILGVGEMEWYSDTQLI